MANHVCCWHQYGKLGKDYRGEPVQGEVCCHCNARREMRLRVNYRQHNRPHGAYLPDEQRTYDEYHKNI